MSTPQINSTENPLPSTADVSTPPVKITLPELFEPIEPIRQIDDGLVTSKDVDDAVKDELVENYFLRDLMKDIPINEDEGIELSHIDEILSNIDSYHFELVDIF